MPVIKRKAKKPNTPAKAPKEVVEDEIDVGGVDLGLEESGRGKSKFDLIQDPKNFETIFQLDLIRYIYHHQNWKLFRIYIILFQYYF